MRSILNIILILGCNLSILYAQDTLNQQRVQPRYWITLNNNSPRISTRLFEVKDSSLVISKTSKLSEYYIRNFTVSELNINQIKSVRYLNTNNVTAGMVLGGLAGMLVGVVIGTNEEDSPDSFLGSGQTAESKAAGDIFYGAIIGAGIGALVGSFRIKIPLNGNPADYSRYKSLLEKQSVKYKYLSVH